MNRNLFRISVLLLVMVMLLSACDVAGLEGSGRLVSETREVSDFDRIVLSGVGRVILTQGEEEALEVETDDNLMEYIVTEVRSGTLYLEIETPDATGINPTRLTYTLSVIDLVELRNSGSGNIEADSIETGDFVIDSDGSGNIVIDSLVANNLEVTFDGSGSIELSGEVASQTLRVNGSGNYQARALASDRVEIELDGSSNAEIRAEKSLEGELRGSGTITYYGEPVIDVEVLGSGRIRDGRAQ